MTTLLKLSESEFSALKELKEAMEKVSHLTAKNSNVWNFLSEKDIDSDILDNGLYDLKNDTLLEKIEAYLNGDLKGFAYDSDGVGFMIIDIMHYQYNNIFGYATEKGEKVFYICETKESYNEELERDESIFFVDDEPIILEDCIRINI